MSESIGVLAESRDTGVTPGVAFRAMLEAGLDADLASEFLNLVYIEAKDVSAEELETTSFAICVQNLN